MSCAMLLHELLKVASAGLYVAVEPILSSNILLQEWAASNGIEPRDDYHVTVLYSRKVVHVDKQLNVEHFASPMRFDRFGNSLVLLLEAPTLSLRHEALMSRGATYDFPVYKPHITLVGEAKEIPDPKMLPNFRLVLGNEYFEPLDLTAT